MTTHPTYASLSGPKTLFLRSEYKRTIRQAGLEYDEGYFDALISMYRDPARTYHNEIHIAHVLERIRDLSHFLPIQDLIVVKLAAFYHDCVYVPGWDQNEIQSAEIAYDHLIKMGYVDVFMVKAAIEHTAEHKPGAGPRSIPYQMICDADLYELGTESYWENGIKIWHEFGQPDDEIWVPGRRKFLETYLNRARLFHLPGQEELETSARSNMQQELQILGGCKNDTDGDGDCGKKYCPFCGSNR